MPETSDSFVTNSCTIKSYSNCNKPLSLQQVYLSRAIGASCCCAPPMQFLWFAVHSTSQSRGPGNDGGGRDASNDSNCVCISILRRKRAATMFRTETSDHTLARLSAVLEYLSEHLKRDRLVAISIYLSIYLSIYPSIYPSIHIHIDI